MYDGHMTPVDALRHSPIFMHRSAAPRIPPAALKRSRVAYGGAGGCAASRRCSVIAGAFTIFPGFIRFPGSKSRFVSCMAT